MGLSMEKLSSSIAKTYGLDPNLVMAIIHTESRNDPNAMRYERGYRYLVNFNSPLVSGSTEKMQQSTSWGLMQIMGATARDMGCKEPWLNCLLDPETNIKYGCQHLARLIKKHGVRGGVSSYNQGSPRKDVNGELINVAYVNKVMDKMKELEVLQSNKTIQPASKKKESKNVRSKN